MVALGVFNGTPSQAGDAEPTSSTSPSAASRSNSRLRNQTGLSGAKNVSHTGAGNFLRSRWRVKLIDKKRKVKHFGLRIEKGDEEVFRVHHFFQRAVNLAEQFIKIGGLIQRVDDVGKHHALCFQAMKFRDVLIAEQNTLHIGIAQSIDGLTCRTSATVRIWCEGCSGKKQMRLPAK